MLTTRILSFAVALLLSGTLTATARAGFFPGDAIDGPNPDLRALGDVDMARDGTGVVVYVRAVGGIDRVFASRFDRGAFQPAEQLDAGLPGPSSQPVVGAADNGRLAVAFVSGGMVYGVVRPAGQGFAAPIVLGPGLDPSVDLSINGTGYASFTSAGDVRIARLDRRTNVWTGLAQPVDVDPARQAGVGPARSKIAISADGIGVVTWGEAGHVFARKMFNTGISNAPQDLTPPSFAGRMSATSSFPEIDAEDDSSYAWVVFRQDFTDGGSRILARRQRGTGFDPPVAVDVGDEQPSAPRIDLNGRGQGFATTTGLSTGHPMAAVLDRRDTFGAGGRILIPSVPGTLAVPTISENNSAVVAAIVGGPRAVVVRSYRDRQGNGEGLLSRPEFGAVQPALGFDAASDRAGGVLVAWMQGEAGNRRLVGGLFDREPGSFRGYNSQHCCRNATPSLSWQKSFDLWGTIRYEVSVDGTPVGETTGNSFKLGEELSDGTHKWQVTATDIRGQSTRSKTRRLRIDARRPLLSVSYKRSKRVVTLSVRARDNARAPKRTSGMKGVVVSWGDRTKGSRGRSRVRAKHRYRRKGTYPLEITATDKAGNETVSKRTVRIR